MSKTRGLSLSGIGLGLALWLSATAGAAPWDKLFSMHHVDADPNKSYPLTEKNGPWMILAYSFSGEKASQQAHDFVFELRKRYKLPAYIYEKKFEFGKDVKGRGLDRYGRPVSMKYLRGSERDEIAVLVGDFERADDPNTQETLHALKYLRPDALSPERQKSTSDPLAGWRLFYHSIMPEGDANKKLGPMGQAFATQNPLLPSDFTAQKGVDKLVLQMNEGVDHSLLDCPGKYTVQVAHFTGRAKITIKRKEIEDFQSGQTKFDKTLEEAAINAHEMVEALRKHGIEAYEFHDRNASLVTIGSFNSVGQNGENGVIELDPRIHGLIEQFRGQHTMAPKTLSQIVPGWKKRDLPFDAQPILVHVPKRSISAMLNGSTAAIR